MIRFNTTNEISELKIEELDTVVGGTNWGRVADTIRAVNTGVGFLAMGGIGYVAELGAIQVLTQI